MANFKKELKAIVARFDAAQEAFTQGSDDAAKKQAKSKKKLKSAKAKVKSLEQKVASLEQQLKVAKDKPKDINSTDGPVTSKTKSKSKSKSKDKAEKSKSATKSTGARLGRRSNTTTASAASGKQVKDNDDSKPTAEEMATAVSDAPAVVSEAAAEMTTPKPRRGRPSKASKTATAVKTKEKAAAKAKAPAGDKPKSTGRRGRPSTKAPASPLTKIAGVGATMATRFEESGIDTVQKFAKLSDDEMKEVLVKCGPRYRSADHDRMEGYRQAAAEAINS